VEPRAGGVEFVERETPVHAPQRGTCPISPPSWEEHGVPFTLLTGDDWAPWFEWAVNSARESLYLSIYMISHHWRDPATKTLDLTKTLADAARRGLQCRGIVDQPNVQGRKEGYNVKAALQLQEAGWLMRKVPDQRTLHEKVLIIDRRLCCVGSHNISKASATSNYDTTLAIESPTLAEHLIRQFWQRWRIAVPLARKA